MRFWVPQFLEIEDKIFGPLTFKQFVYLIGGAGMCFVIYKLLNPLLGIIPIVIIAGISLSLAFLRPNNRPFIETLEAFLLFLLKDKLYIWQQRRKKPSKIQPVKRERILEIEPKLTGSKLHDLSWGLDILDLRKNKGQ